LGPVGGLSARQSNGCLPGREEKRRIRQVRPPHNLRFRHHQLHTPCQTWTCDINVRSDVYDAARVSSSECCDVIHVGGYHIANIYKPPTEHWNNTNLPPVLSHPAVLVGNFNSHHPDWGYQEAELNEESLQEWALNSDYLLLHDAKQRGTSHSARWQRDYSPDLCWMSTTVGHPQRW